MTLMRERNVMSFIKDRFGSSYNTHITYDSTLKEFVTAHLGGFKLNCVTDFHLKNTQNLWFQTQFLTFNYSFVFKLGVPTNTGKSTIKNSVM